MNAITRTFQRGLSWTLCAAAILPALAGIGWAQSQAGTGQIVGTVRDESRALVPGATITATSDATGLMRETLSTEAGTYRLVALPPGTYKTSAQLSGFKTAQSTVTVNVGGSVTVDFTLAVGEISEVIEVTATSLIETTRSESDALIGRKAIVDLPIVGRRFQDFATLTPTVQVEPTRGQISFSGQRGINGYIAIDGADYNQPFFGGIRGGERSNDAFTIPQEAIGEFQVVANGFSAEFGRSTGGVLNAVTKSGTNQWRGSAFYFLRHKNLGSEDARGRESITTLNQFGGSIGGPLVENRSFIFGAFEGQINDNPRFVEFTRLAGLTPSPANAEAFDFYQSLATPFTQTNDAYTALVRFDHSVTDSHRFSGRYNYSRNTAENAVATGNAIAPGTSRSLATNGTEGDRSHTVVGSLTSTFSPTLVNEFRGLYSRESRPRLPNTQQPLLATSIGEYGTRSFLPTTEYDYRLQFADNLNWTVGGHSLKFGGEFNQLVADQLFGFNQFGTYQVFSTTDFILDSLSLGSDDSDDPVNRFDTRTASYLLQIGNLQARMEGQELAFYVQDAWRMTSNFTLNLGLRWEGYFNPEPDTSNTALTNLVAGTQFPLGRVNPALIPDNTNQWMPRVGFAWDPSGDGKTVVRGGVGLYYARNPLLLMAGPINNFRTPPGDVSVLLPFALPRGYVCNPIAAGDTCDTIYWQFRRIGVDLNTTPLTALPQLTPADLTAIAGALGLSVDPFAGANVTTWEDDYHSPRSLNWNLGIQRQLSDGFKVGADFAYINTIRLQRNRELNLPLPFLVAADMSQRPCFGLTTCTGLPSGVSSPRQGRPIPTLGSVTLRESSARSVYRALTLRGEYRHSRYQVQAFYTYAKNESDDDNERSAGGFSYENGFNLQPEFGFSDLDFKHLFRFNALVELPYGLTVSGLSRLSSGRAIDATTGLGDANGDRGGPDRPYSAPGTPFVRNSFRDGPQYAADIRIIKSFRVTEETRISATADFFNVFNFDNITIGSRNREYGLGINPSTGQPLGPPESFLRKRLADGGVDPNNEVGAPFQVQLGVRLDF